jgi:hypothetical protein
LTGFYRGLVRKKLDSGRLKIFIPGIYDDKYEPLEMADHLPDAEPASPIFNKSSMQSGMFGVPDVGSIVWVFFANLDANFPVYFATTLNAVPGVGQASWNRLKKKKKYTGQLMKNGPAEILMDETSQITLRCNSTEDIVEKQSDTTPAEILMDRENATNRIVLQADDVVIACKNFVVRSENTEVDSAFKILLRARAAKMDLQSPSIMLNADNGDGNNTISFKSATGLTVI